MADASEQAFIKTFVNTVSSQPITFADDYQQQPQNWLRRVPVFPVPVPDPPVKKKAEEATASSSVPLTLTFKSLKPAASYPLAVHPTDTIASIKAQLAASVPALSSQQLSLLLKGKALADGKLLREYAVKDGDTVNLISKPRAGGEGPGGSEGGISAEAMEADKQTLGPAAVRPKRGHQRIPSVVLSPSPSADTPGVVEKDILLTLDPHVHAGEGEVLSSYQSTVVKPEFWERLFVFLKKEFMTDEDALTAFENFLRASKGAMTASQIAKIRDQVGIMGMAGT